MTTWMTSQWQLETYAEMTSSCPKRLNSMKEKNTKELKETGLMDIIRAVTEPPVSVEDALLLPQLLS